MLSIKTTSICCNTIRDLLCLVPSECGIFFTQYLKAYCFFKLGWPVSMPQPKTVLNHSTNQNSEDCRSQVFASRTPWDTRVFLYDSNTNLSWTKVNVWWPTRTQCKTGRVSLTALVVIAQVGKVPLVQFKLKTEYSLNTKVMSPAHPLRI